MIVMNGLNAFRMPRRSGYQFAEKIIGIMSAPGGIVILLARAQSVLTTRNPTL